MIFSIKKQALYFCISFLMLFVSHNSFSQAYTPFPDSNAVWNVFEFTLFYPDSQQYRTKFYGLINDTIINTIKYNKLYFNDGLIDSTIEASSPNTSYLCAIRQDTLLRKVYFIPKDSVNELIFYDFSINVGDTFFVYNEIGNKVKAWCLGLGPILISGKIRNEFSIKTDNISFYGGHIWVEGVGNMRGLFETFNDYSSNKAVMCLTVNDSLYYKFDGNGIWDIGIDTSIYKTCYNKGVNILTNMSLLRKPTDNVIIYSNPLIHSSLILLSENFKLDNITIDIFDLQGKIIKTLKDLKTHQIILNRIDFKAAGLYFVRIKSDNHLETIKLMVQ